MRSLKNRCVHCSLQAVFAAAWPVIVCVCLTGCYLSDAVRPRGTFEYAVRSGDTLYSISQRFGVSMTELRNINRIWDPRKMMVGQVLKIPEESGGARGRFGGRGLTGIGGIKRYSYKDTRRDGLRMVKLGAAQKHVGAMVWPLPRGVGRISSSFNWRPGTFHEGIDIAVAQGTPVYAAHAGRVIYADRRGGYGRLVVIRGESIMTIYAHNRSLRVSEGDQVQRGRVIAHTGSTGRSTGPHLHFETRIWDPAMDGYVAVDPWVFYRQKG